MPRSSGLTDLPILRCPKSTSGEAFRYSVSPWRFMYSMLSKKHGVPPPQLTTTSSNSATSCSMLCSMRRNPSSPDSSNISFTVLRMRLSMYQSRS